MHSETYNAIVAKIEAIKADPLGWAKADRAEYVASLGGMKVRTLTDAELLENAAAELATAESMIAGVTPDAPERQMSTEANARTKSAVYGLNS
jgi:hypothetical protein